MEDYKNNKSRRSFGRTDKVLCKLYVSKGAEKWTEVYAVNISAGGTKFISRNIELQENDIIFVRVDVLSGFSEFVFKTKARISRKEGNETYAVEFLDMSKTNQIMLDEIVHANNKKFSENM